MKSIRTVDAAAAGMSTPTSIHMVIRFIRMRTVMKKAMSTNMIMTTAADAAVIPMTTADMITEIIRRMRIRRCWHICWTTISTMHRSLLSLRST